jgi:O-antigen ligase
LPFFAYLSATTKNEKLKLFWSRAMILQALAIFLTFAWGAVLGIVIFAVGWLLLKKGLWVVKVIGGLALIVAVAGVAYWVWESKPKFALNETGTILTANPESRERMVVKGFLAFQERPILGWGFANFDYAFDSVVWPIPLGNDVYVDKGHSTIFELLVTTGVVGLGLYLLVVLWAVFRNYRMLKDDKGEYRVWQKTLLLVLLLYLFHSQTNVISIGEELMFWLVLGVVGSGSGER